MPGRRGGRIIVTSLSKESGGNEAGPAYRAGFVAIVGRPNVGKSTLLNRTLGVKLAAVSPRPQTTHVRILGVLTSDAYQAAFLATPEAYQDAEERGETDAWTRKVQHDKLVAAVDEDTRIGRMYSGKMVQEGARALEEADVAVLVVEPRLPGGVERAMADDFRRRGLPAIVAINKVDSVGKASLLPVIEAYAGLDAFAEIVPVSALRHDGIGLLLDIVVQRLPEAEAPLFPAGHLTDRSEQFLVSEIVREKVFQLFRQELPYAAAVTVEEWEEESEQHGGKTHIAVRIHPERDSQRGILLGKGGLALKEVGVQARRDIEALLGKPVFLELWVRPRPRWRKDD